MTVICSLEVAPHSGAFQGGGYQLTFKHRSQSIRLIKLCGSNCKSPPPSSECVLQTLHMNRTSQEPHGTENMRCNICLCEERCQLSPDSTNSTVTRTPSIYPCEIEIQGRFWRWYRSKKHSLFQLWGKCKIRYRNWDRNWFFQGDKFTGEKV